MSRGCCRARSLVSEAASSCPAEAVALSLEDQSDSRRYEGLGLGLAISRAVAEKHGGAAEIFSIISIGFSCFQQAHGRHPHR